MNDTRVAMTERKQALQYLRDRVEAGDADGNTFRDAFGSPCQDMEYEQRVQDAKMAHRGSLDAALALYNAECQDLPVNLWLYSAVHGQWGCTVGHYDTVYNENPARAWLQAILSALIAEEGE